MIPDLLAAVARFAAWIVLEIILERVMYPSGAILLKVLTFGRYPDDQPSDIARTMISMLPLVILLVGVTLWYL